ncbi:hypothetical protein NST07_25765 [Paenibacillus sp. FSL L8-0340]|uniref:hypothetical protein n=1 Tax=Paenibacillus sp. FSL L8-0340 TaxID=2954685 RepID=UPI003158ACD3
MDFTGLEIELVRLMTKYGGNNRELYEDLHAIVQRVRDEQKKAKATNAQTNEPITKQ